MQTDLRARVVALEQWRVGRDIQSARHDEKWAHMEKRFADIESKINGINDSLSWITRLIIGAIVLGALGFMMSGALKPL